MLKIFALLLILASSIVHAKEGRPIKLAIALSAESYSVETKESNSTNKASASFFSTQVIPSIGFFVTDKILLGVQYSQSFAGEFSVSGIGASGRYYFMGGAPKKVELDNIEVETAANYSVYGQVAYKNLSIGAGDTDIRFSALEAAVGGEKFIDHNYFVFATFNLAQLSSSENRTGLSLGFTGGIGYHY